MKRAISILCATLAMHSFAAAQEQAYVQSLAAKNSYYVQEEITIQLRFGIEKSFLSDKLIQPFRRRLGLPVQIDAGWITTLTGTADTGLSFVLNGNPHSAQPFTDGRPYASAQVETILRVAEPGELRLAAAVMRYSYADSFSEDLLGGRVPRGRKDALLSGNELTLAIKPLPIEGRPTEFTGAVGEFTLRAEANTGPIKAGESFKLVLHLEGRGNFDSFELPKLDQLTDFHLYGQLEERSATGRQVTYDLAALNTDVSELPAIAFAYFDPSEPGSYHRLQTKPIQLEVLASTEAPSPAAPPSEDPGLPRENDIFDIRPVPTELTLVQVGSISPIVLVLALIAPWLLAAGFWSFRRVQERIRARPTIEPAPAQAATFKQQVAAWNANPGDVFATYLAAHLRCQPAAIIAPDLGDHLIAAGISPELATKCTAALDDYVDARYGDHELGHDSAAICALIDLCDQQFTNRRRGA